MEQPRWHESPAAVEKTVKYNELTRELSSQHFHDSRPSFTVHCYTITGEIPSRLDNRASTRMQAPHRLVVDESVCEACSLLVAVLVHLLDCRHGGDCQDAKTPRGANAMQGEEQHEQDEVL